MPTQNAYDYARRYDSMTTILASRDVVRIRWSAALVSIASWSRYLSEA